MIVKIAKQSDCSKRHRVFDFVEATLLGHQLPAQIRGSQTLPSLNRMSMASILIPPAYDNSEKREISYVGRTTSLDTQNISQKRSNPLCVFCPIQPHQCGGAHHNRIAGIVHLRTPTARKKTTVIHVCQGKKSKNFFFPHVTQREVIRMNFFFGVRGVCGVMSVGLGCVCVAWNGVMLAVCACCLEANFSPDP